jgi:uncharacterized protein (TIGR00266 family)
MRHEIHNKPDFASLHVWLDRGEQVVTEAGAMMAMSGDLEMETNMKGGLLGAAKRALGGESVFMNTYTAKSDAQRLDVAPASPGDILHLPLTGGSVIVQSGSYLCCTPGIQVDSKWGGAKSFFGGEGLFMLRCSGTGDLWLSSYGAIHPIDVQGTYTVDTSHIVAFDDTLTYGVRKVGGLKSLFFSGEGLVCEFSGRGRLWIQTRNASSLASFLHPFRPVKNKG